MNKPIITWDEYQARKEIELLGKVVEAAVWPFKPGRVVAWALDSYPFDYSGVVETERCGEFRYLFPSSPFGATRPEELRDRLLQETFNHFRYRPRVKPESNIILGEE